MSNNDVISANDPQALEKLAEKKQRCVDTQRIKHMKKVVAEDKAHEMNCDGFLEMIRKYTDVTELTPEILSEFIDKIVVHHRVGLSIRRGATIAQAIITT